MKRILAWFVAALACGTAAWGAVTPDEVIGAVDTMTPEQALLFSQKLESKLWKPIPEGFFSRMALDLGVWAGSLNDGGLDLGLFWRAFDPRFRLGLRMGSWGASDSNLEPGGYSRADLTGASLALAANMQWVRNAQWLVWTEVAPGIGSVRLELVNTPAGQATTLRTVDGGYAQLDLQAGVALRVNPVLTVSLSGGYRLADGIDLNEGGEETVLDFDASGAFARVALGFNF
jgi:hypothetical protein